jgi:hypothetical protein
VQALVVPSGNPLEGCCFQFLHALERCGSFNQFAFVRAIDAFGQGVVVGNLLPAGGGQDAGFLKGCAVQAADVLGAVITMIFLYPCSTIHPCA